MVYVSPDSPWMKLAAPFLAKKNRLASDSWGADDRYVKHIYDPIIQLIKDAVPNEADRKLYPPIWTTEKRVVRLVRSTLIAEFLVKEWAEMFRGLDEDGLDELMRSFRFENCLKREGLNKVLTDNAVEV